MPLTEVSVPKPHLGSQALDAKDGGDSTVHPQKMAHQQIDINSRISQIEAEIAQLRVMGILRDSPAMEQKGEVPVRTESPLAERDARRILPSADKSFPVNSQPKTTVGSDVAVERTQNDVTIQVLSIIQGYGRNEENTEGKAWLGSIKFEPRIRAQVEAEVPVELVLPAFPWKSVNKVDKVLGALPDLGELLGLGRLQRLCEDIQDVYPPGAYVTITSDGLVYSDLVGISDEEVYDYGAGLRQMAARQGYDRLKFIRIMNLLGLTDKTHLTKEEYLATVPSTRKLLLEKYLPSGFDVQDAIRNDNDIKLTYCGYQIFLSKDLHHSPVTAEITNNNSAYRRLVKRVAQNMITRGKAFAAAIDDNFPQHTRLSIHRSSGRSKLSFPLVPQIDHFSMTPWHCSIAVTADGQFRTAHASAMRDRYDLIRYGDQPYYFRERSSLWEWDVPVEFSFFYPQGVQVTAKRVEGEPSPKLGSAESAKLRALGKVFKTVVTTGFC